MTQIKTAEERMKESGKYADPLEIVSFYKQEIAELRAALEQAQKEVTHWKANHADLQKRLYAATHRTDVSDIEVAKERLKLYDHLTDRIAELEAQLSKVGTRTTTESVGEVSRTIVEVVDLAPKLEQSSNPLQLPAQPIEPDYNDIQLAEIIMSDCGVATNNSQSLVDRIAGRIAKHMAAQPEQEPVAWISNDATFPLKDDGSYWLYPSNDGNRIALCTKPQGA